MIAWLKNISMCLGRLYRHWILDRGCVWLLPILGVAGVLSSAFLTYDYTDIYKERPNWRHQIDLIRGLLPLVLIASQVGVLVLSVLQAFRQNSIIKLENHVKVARIKVDLIAENIEALVDGLLLKLSEKLQIGKGEASRLTIYIHNKNAHFISFGRYAPDPSYSSKGRNLLPDSSGCIAQAWKSDWCYEGNLTYKDARKKYGLTKEIFQKMRMKSKFYAVKRIDSSNKSPLAVLVFESETVDKFPEAQIRSILDGEEVYLAEIINCLKDHIPNPQDAQERGF